eukprot:Rhum_TRINITY_DN15917_c0_g1::Rhum_TRINITY_DN15917_c0_g1_i1::g.162444::m.162444
MGGKQFFFFASAAEGRGKGGVGGGGLELEGRGYSGSLFLFCLQLACLLLLSSSHGQGINGAFLADAFADTKGQVKVHRTQDVQVVVHELRELGGKARRNVTVAQALRHHHKQEGGNREADRRKLQGRSQLLQRAAHTRDHKSAAAVSDSHSVGTAHSPEAWSVEVRGVLRRQCPDGDEHQKVRQQRDVGGVHVAGLLRVPHRVQSNVHDVGPQREDAREEREAQQHLRVHQPGDGVRGPELVAEHRGAQEDRHKQQDALHRPVDVPQRERPRVVLLPRAEVEAGAHHQHVRQRPGVVLFGQHQGRHRAQRNQVCAHGVAAVVEKLAQRARRAGAARLLAVQGVERLVAEDAHGSQQPHPRRRRLPQVRRVRRRDRVAQHQHAEADKRDEVRRHRAREEVDAPPPVRLHDVLARQRQVRAGVTVALQTRQALVRDDAAGKGDHCFFFFFWRLLVFVLAASQ